MVNPELSRQLEYSETAVGKQKLARNLARVGLAGGAILEGIGIYFEDKPAMVLGGILMAGNIVLNFITSKFKNENEVQASDIRTLQPYEEIYFGDKPNQP